MKASKNNYYQPLLIAIHVFSWLVVFGFPLMVAEKGFDWDKFFRHSMVPLFSMVVFYANYLLLVPYYLFRNKVRQYAVLNILLILVISLLLHYFQGFLLVPNNISMDRPKIFSSLILHWVFYGRHLLMMIFVAGLGSAFRITFRWRETEERLIEAERARTEAELKNLKSQINPHFLLNTLNNIYALIAFDGHKAQEAVQELSKLLRYMLYDNQSKLVSLSKELEFIENYIALMRIRLSDAVRISVRLEPGVRPLKVAPLIFISLIENSFKHGISPTEESFIHIDIHGKEEGYICCKITNSNFPKSKADKSGSGIGLEQVNRRLKLIYPNKYKWERSVSPDGKTYTSLLIIETTEL